MSLTSWDWRAQIRREGALGENWLFAYEAVRRKWTSDMKLRAEIMRYPILNRALADNVPFIEEQALDAGNINLSRRVFRTRAAPASATTQLTAATSKPGKFVYEGEKSITELYEGDVEEFNEAETDDETIGY